MNINQVAKYIVENNLDTVEVEQLLGTFSKECYAKGFIRGVEKQSALDSEYRKRKRHRQEIELSDFIMDFANEQDRFLKNY